MADESAGLAFSSGLCLEGLQSLVMTLAITLYWRLCPTGGVLLNKQVGKSRLDLDYSEGVHRKYIHYWLMGIK